MAEFSQHAAAGAGTTVRLGADAQDVPDSEHLSVCEALDRLLHKGVVLRGEVAIAVAGIDLIYVGLQVLLASTETARSFIQREQTPITDQPQQAEQTGQTNPLLRVDSARQDQPIGGVRPSDVTRRLL